MRRLPWLALVLLISNLAGGALAHAAGPTCLQTGGKSLTSDFPVADNSTSVTIPDLSCSLSVAGGQSIRIDLNADAIASTSGRMLQSLTINCDGLNCADSGNWDHVNTTINREATSLLNMKGVYVLTTPVTAPTSTYTFGVTAYLHPITAASGESITIKAGATMALSIPGTPFSFYGMNYTCASGMYDCYVDRGSGGTRDWQVYNSSIDSVAKATVPFKQFGTGFGKRMMFSDPTGINLVPGAPYDIATQPEITTCYSGTDSCPPAQRGTHTASENVGSDFTIDLRLYSLNPTGGTCAVVASTGAVAYHLADLRHHQKFVVTLSGTVPAQTTCANKFYTAALVTWTGNNPMQVETSYYSSGVLEGPTT